MIFIYNGEISNQKYLTRALPRSIILLDESAETRPAVSGLSRKPKPRPLGGVLSHSDVDASHLECLIEYERLRMGVPNNVIKERGGNTSMHRSQLLDGIA